MLNVLNENCEVLSMTIGVIDSLGRQTWVRCDVNTSFMVTDKPSCYGPRFCNNGDNIYFYTWLQQCVIQGHNAGLI